MSENVHTVEIHGCIVCGKIFNLMVLYSPAGEYFGSTAINSEGQSLPDPSRPLVACRKHSASDIQKALTRYRLALDEEEHTGN
jgi:hypothetical protein